MKILFPGLINQGTSECLILCLNLSEIISIEEKVIINALQSLAFHMKKCVTYP